MESLSLFAEPTAGAAADQAAVPNEVDRVVVAFPRDTAYGRYISNEHQLWLVNEAHAGAVSWRFIDPEHPCQWAYSHLDTLCCRLAPDVEFHRRRVAGAWIPAEAYVALWRKAKAQPVLPAELKALGIALIVTMTAEIAGHAAAATQAEALAAAGAFDHPALQYRTADLAAWRIVLDSPSAVDFTKLVTDAANGRHSKTSFEVQLLAADSKAEVRA